MQRHKKIADTEDAKIIVGPIEEENKTKSIYSTFLSSGYNEIHTKTGNSAIVVPGTYKEVIKGQIYGDDRDVPQKENVARSIFVEDGDIAIVAKNGNIKLKADNIFVECSSGENDGSFMVNANEAITMVSGEQMTLGGAKVCISSADSITLNATGLLNFLCSDIEKGSPLGSLGIMLPKELDNFIKAVITSCN